MGREGHIRVVIADDHRLFREGIRLILSREEGIALVGEAAPGLETIELVNQLQPDVVLLDISVPGMGVIELIRRLKQNSPATKLLFLTAASDEALIFKAMKVGAKGYLSRVSTAADFTKAIQAVHHGELWVERNLMARFVEEEAATDGSGKGPRGRTQAALTTREQEILRLLRSGRTNKEIAQSLLISEKTVKSHLSNIFRKLNVRHRVQAVLCVDQHGLTEGVLPTK